MKGEEVMNKAFKKFCALALAAACVALPAVSAAAAPEDTIDMERKASLTIHKYDLTAAAEDGVDVSVFTADGKKDDAAETALKRYEIKGVEFTYVRVGGISTESADGSVRIVYDLPGELESILGLEDSQRGHQHSSDEINAAMRILLADNTAGKNALEDYIRTASGRTAMPLTDENGITRAANLEPGLYLLVETRVPANVHTTVDPFFVSLPMTDSEGEAWFYDVEVYPKNQTDPFPTLDKLVRQEDDAVLYDRPEYTDTATASEGDRVEFIYVSHLPRITSEATYLEHYTFVDKMDKGLTYNQDAAVYFYDNETDARANHKEAAADKWEHGSVLFTESYEESNGDYNQMTVTPTAEGLRAINPGKSEQYLVVSYSAVVNSDATPVLGDSGNTNDVSLTWSRTSDDYMKTVEDRAKVYTYGIKLTKKFSGSKEADPADVEFVLQNQTDGHYVTAIQAQEGVYYVTDASKGAEEEKGTVFSPAADGTMVIRGLEADTYSLAEISTADGFSLLKEPVIIDFKATADVLVPSETILYNSQDIQNQPHGSMTEAVGNHADATVDGKAAAMVSDTGKNKESTNAAVDMTVVNTPISILPKTGGCGTFFFTLAGCGTALAGIVILTKKHKKEDV